MESVLLPGRRIRFGRREVPIGWEFTESERVTLPWVGVLVMEVGGGLGFVWVCEEVGGGEICVVDEGEGSTISRVRTDGLGM